MRLLRKSGDVPKRSLWQKIKDIALMDVAVLASGGVNPGSLEDLEQLLLEADFGVPVTLRLVEEVERRAARGQVMTQREFREALSEGVETALVAGNSDARLAFAATAPTVILVVGVNGAGKPTFIGKLSDRFRRDGKRVMVAAGDTFRAGAIDQLRLWAERTGAGVVGAEAGGGVWRVVRRREGGSRPGGGAFRPHRRRDDARRGRSHRRHGGPVAHERRADGRIAQGRARHRQAASWRSARNAPRARRHDRAERPATGQDLRPREARDG